MYNNYFIIIIILFKNNPLTCNTACKVKYLKDKSETDHAFRKVPHASNLMLHANPLLWKHTCGCFIKTSQSSSNGGFRGFAVGHSPQIIILTISPFGESCTATHTKCPLKSGPKLLTEPTIKQEVYGGL